MTKTTKIKRRQKSIYPRTGGELADNIEARVTRLEALLETHLAGAVRRRRAS